MASVDRAAQWRDRVERAERSGVEVSEFCKREGFSTAAFYSWRKRLRVGKPPTKSVPVQFVEVGAARSSLEVVTTSGVVVRVSRDFDEQTLRRVLDVLRDQR